MNIIELHYTGFRLIIWRINSQRNVGQRCGFSNSTSVWKHYKIQLPLRLQLIKILLHIQMKDYFSKKYIAYYVILLFTDLHLYIFLDAWWILPKCSTSTMWFTHDTSIFLKNKDSYFTSTHLIIWTVQFVIPSIRVYVYCSCNCT